HASVVGVAQHIPRCVMGFLMTNELLFLGSALDHPNRPLAALVGGAKVSSKLDVMLSLLRRVDKLLVGGAMVYTFLRALGHDVGESLVEEGMIPVAKEILEFAQKNSITLVLGQDSLVHAPTRTVSNDAIPAGWMGVDIGPETVARFTQELADCRTVLWNGPMGITEKAEYSHGTEAMALCLRALTQRGATTIICGGETVAAGAERQWGVGAGGSWDEGKWGFSHVSTGGGAALEFLEGRCLPGVEALDDEEGLGAGAGGGRGWMGNLGNLAPLGTVMEGIEGGGSGGGHTVSSGQTPTGSGPRSADSIISQADSAECLEAEYFEGSLSHDMDQRQDMDL
ncbi:phosphoglycerate kinase, partial [Ochromonadaceae sp. CCMP2298]